VHPGCITEYLRCKNTEKKGFWIFIKSKNPFFIDILRLFPQIAQATHPPFCEFVVCSSCFASLLPIQLKRMLTGPFFISYHIFQ
jgi:hypothetical protein